MIQFVFAFGGVGSNYVGIYARCIRISLCTITTPLLLYEYVFIVVATYMGHVHRSYGSKRFFFF